MQWHAGIIIIIIIATARGHCCVMMFSVSSNMDGMVSMCVKRLGAASPSSLFGGVLRVGVRALSPNLWGWVWPGEQAPPP